MILVVIGIGVAILLLANRKEEMPFLKYEGEELLEKVHPEFRKLIDGWKTHPNTFDIKIVGGMRNDEAEVARLYAIGMSNAKNLSQTPHGRGGAIDIHPVEFNPRIPWPDQPTAIKNKFLIFGMYAEGAGYEWGGRWRGSKFPYGDQPHVERKDWRTMPYPPKPFTGENNV